MLNKYFSTGCKVFRFLDRLPESFGRTDCFSGSIIFSASVIFRAWAGFSVVATSKKRKSTQEITLPFQIIKTLNIFYWIFALFYKFHLPLVLLRLQASISIVTAMMITNCLTRPYKLIASLCFIACTIMFRTTKITNPDQMRSWLNYSIYYII